MEQEEKKYPCVVFKKIKKVTYRDEGGKEHEKEEPSFWYLNVQQGHRSTDKISQFIKAGNKLVGYQNLDRDYRLANGQMVRAANFRDIRAFVDAHTGRTLDPRLNDEVIADVMAQKVANEQGRKAGK